VGNMSELEYPWVNFIPGPSISTIPVIDSLIDFGEGTNWELSAISTKVEGDSKGLFQGFFPIIDHMTADRLDEFKEKYGYLISGFKFVPKNAGIKDAGINDAKNDVVNVVPLINKKSLVTKDEYYLAAQKAAAFNFPSRDPFTSGSRSLFLRQPGDIGIPYRGSELSMDLVDPAILRLGDEPVPHNYSDVINKENKNEDLSLVPIFGGMNILAPFRSTQYVMDSLYGTWAQWKDVNLMDGVTHLDEFYFVVPQDYSPNINYDGFVYNTSMLCKFNMNFDGDFAELMHPTEKKPITVSYKTAATNFNSNQVKQLLKIKIYGTASTFWGENANKLSVTMYSDFLKNPTYYYQHETQKSSIHKILGLPAGFDLRKLSYSQMKQYYKKYIELSSDIRNIEMSLIGKPSTRIALEMNMEIEEHNIIIYGYELYFKLLNKL
jgi:hypothetical protein